MSGTLKAGEEYFAEWHEGDATAAMRDSSGAVVATVPVIRDAEDLRRAWTIEEQR